jgi:hypothetical protein
MNRHTIDNCIQLAASGKQVRLVAQGAVELTDIMSYLEDQGVKGAVTREPGGWVIEIGGAS